MQTGREFMRKSVRKKSEKIIIKKKQYNNKRVFRQKWKTLNTVYSFFFACHNICENGENLRKKINLRLLFLRIKKFLIEKNTKQNFSVFKNLRSKRGREGTEN